MILIGFQDLTVSLACDGKLRGSCFVFFSYFKTIPSRLGLGYGQGIFIIRTWQEAGRDGSWQVCTLWWSHRMLGNQRVFISDKRPRKRDKTKGGGQRKSCPPGSHVGNRKSKSKRTD